MPDFKPIDFTKMIEVDDSKPESNIDKLIFLLEQKVKELEKENENLRAALSSIPDPNAKPIEIKKSIRTLSDLRVKLEQRSFRDEKELPISNK